MSHPSEVSWLKSGSAGLRWARSGIAFYVLVDHCITFHVTFSEWYLLFIVQKYGRAATTWVWINFISPDSRQLVWVADANWLWLILHITRLSPSGWSDECQLMLTDTFNIPHYPTVWPDRPQLAATVASYHRLSPDWFDWIQLTSPNWYKLTPIVFSNAQFLQLIG